MWAANLANPRKRLGRSVLAGAVSMGAMAATALLSLGIAHGAPGDTVRVSVASGGGQGSGFSGDISADGRFVVFESGDGNLVPGDTGFIRDIFVHDRLTSTTERVSVDSSENQGNAESGGATISEDGRFVAFLSFANNLVFGDTNGQPDVFVRDRQNGTTERVSVSDSEAQANDDSRSSAINGDGNVVCFSSTATNLVPGDTNGTTDTFVRDRQAGTTELVSRSSGGQQADSDSDCADISADGRFVVFLSVATNLVPGDTNAFSDVFVRDRLNNSTERVNLDSVGAEANSFSVSGSISADGRFVAFGSDASNLVAGDTNLSQDVFVRDRFSGTTERVSVDSFGSQGNHASRSFGDAISADGRFVTFESDASNLAGDNNCATDIFVHDRQSRVTQLVSVDSACGQGNGPSVVAAISADSRFIAFTSLASNLVPGDTNDFFDAFVHERGDACNISQPIAQIALQPAAAENPVGTMHTLTASVLAGGVPVEGALVRFLVLSGPNRNQTSSPGECAANSDCTTAANGEVSWTYASNGRVGVDRIEACVQTLGCNRCAEAVKEWVILNEAPRCLGAIASPSQLWPPNHQFHPIAVLGVIDPDGDPIDITIESIRQDEPVKETGTGSGNTCPDGTGLGGGMAQVRAERAGNPGVPGDGRVYHIGFTATDDSGAACSSEVRVCVPHSQGSKAGCTDQGPLFDSTVCP